MKSPLAFISTLRSLYRSSREPEQMHLLSHLWWKVVLVVGPVTILCMLSYATWITWSVFSSGPIGSVLVGKGVENVLVKDLKTIQQTIQAREAAYNIQTPTLTDPYKASIKPTN